MRNKVAWYIHNKVAEDRNFLVHISIEKGYIPIKASDCQSDKFSICFVRMAVGNIFVN